MMRKIIPVVFALTIGNLYGQNLDSLHLEVGSSVQVATSGFQPLWSKANKFGMSSNEQIDHITWIEASNKHELGAMRFLSDFKEPLELRYGGTIFNATHYGRTVFQQLFAEVKHQKISIRAGRHRDIWDDLDPNMSVGGLGTSGNALPIPKITIALNDYVDVPFTNSVLQFKGMIGHGWLGRDRFMQSWLHEKSFYGQLNFDNVKLYGGVQHYTEWGGRRPAENIYLDRSFRGFLDVLFVREANDGSVPLDGTRPNRSGDQRGLLEVGVKVELDRVNLHFYNQIPFESGTGIDIRNIDRLFGFRLTPKDSESLLEDFLFEFIYTKQMEKFGKELQSYYNNGSMKTGWEYEGNVIGMPLMTNREDASKYLPITPFRWREDKDIMGNANIVNNRIIGINLASKWRLLNDWSLRTKITPTINYGSRYFENLYGNGNGVFQCYSLIEGVLQTGPLKYAVGLATDFGGLYNNVGATFGVRYTFYSREED